MIATTLLIHVLGGILSLITGLFVLLLPKGGKWHENLGWLYFYAMTIVFLTSLLVSIYRNNIFLLLIGFFSFYLVHTGVRFRFIRDKGSVKWWDKLTTVLYGMIYIALCSYAIYAFVLGNNGLGIVLSSFGLIGVLLWKIDYRYIIQGKRKREGIWLNEHIGRMIGSYIAAFTAFTVNNIQFEPSWILWLSPTIIGFPLIIYFTRKYVR